MKVIALVMCYNEAPLIYRCLSNIYDAADQIIVFEGTVSPFDDQPEHSTDNTQVEINRFIAEKDTESKILYWSPPKNTYIKTRQEYEGWVKNEMLRRSRIEHGDLIYMVDIDEFFKEDNLFYIISYFERIPQLRHAIVEEYQFAYNMRLCFNGSHTGRFLRYVNGARYSASQHFIYPDGTDISRINDVTFKRETSQMYHLCWVKHPTLIREKVLTFKRQSFTYWYNNCYLAWPFDHETAYHNNRTISLANGWSGLGYAEGQDGRLYNFEGELPKALEGYNPDWTDYIKEHYDELRI